MWHLESLQLQIRIAREEQEQARSPEKAGVIEHEVALNNVLEMRTSLKKHRKTMVRKA